MSKVTKHRLSNKSVKFTIHETGSALCPNFDPTITRFIFTYPTLYTVSKHVYSLFRLLVTSKNICESKKTFICNRSFRLIIRDRYFCKIQYLFPVGHAQFRTGLKHDHHRHGHEASGRNMNKQDSSITV